MRVEIPQGVVFHVVQTTIVIRDTLKIILFILISQVTHSRINHVFMKIRATRAGRIQTTRYLSYNK